MKSKLRLVFYFFILCTMLKAQLGGTYSVPGNFPNLAAAIYSLNIAGVNAPVTINIAAGYTETAVQGGYILYNVVGSSSVNTIVFQKFGTGVNPIIYAPATGTNSLGSFRFDALWTLAGSDYVTIDGLDLKDLNVSGSAMIEYGFGLLKDGLGGGCMNNMIKNCRISLNRNNSTIISGMTLGSTGIFIKNSYVYQQDVYMSSAPPSSRNRFYNNLIENCHFGIVAFGSSMTAFTDTAYADSFNDIGGFSSATSNTIINYGGGSASVTASGIYTENQAGLNISYNVINNNTGTGINHLFPLRGITSLSGFNVSISNNTLTVLTGTNNQGLTLIRCTPILSSHLGYIRINNNLLANNTNSILSSNFFGIDLGQGSCADLEINNNTFTNTISSPGVSTVALIQSTTNVVNHLSVNGNTLSFTDMSSTGNSGKMFGIALHAESTTTLNVNNNYFTAFNYSGAVASSSVEFIKVYGKHSSLTYSNNVWNNLQIKTSGPILLMGIVDQVSNFISINSNSITGSFVRTPSGEMRCIDMSNTYSGLPNCRELYYANNFSNVSSTASVSGSSFFSGLSVGQGGATPNTNVQLYNNIISNINYHGSFAGLNVNAGGTGNLPYASAVHHNTISAVDVTNGFIGTSIDMGGTGGLRAQFYDNQIFNLNASGGTTADGLFINTSSVDVYRNKIHSLNCGAATCTITGLRLMSVSNTSIYNNLIGLITASNSTSAFGLAGILLDRYYSSSPTKNVLIDHNTIYLNSPASGSLTSAVIRFSDNAGYQLRNNILVNLSATSGSALACVISGTVTNMSAYGALSDNNLLYAGTPSANRLLLSYVGGYMIMANFQTLSAFQSTVIGRDANSVTENPVFASLTGTAPNFLQLSPSVPTQAESGGTYLPGITQDFGGTSRAIFPDIGAWETPLLPGSDLSGPVVMSSGFTGNHCNSSARTFTVLLSDMSGVATGSLSPKIYYSINNGTYTSTQGVLSSGISTQGVWSFTLAYGITAGDVVRWYLTAQDVASPFNLISFPAMGFNGTNVNAVITVPSPVNSYTAGMALSGVYLVGTGGTFTTLTSAANAYNNACLQGPVTFSLINSLYAAGETFPIVFKNNPGASISNSLLIIPAASQTVAIGTASVFGGLSRINFVDARYITMDGLNTNGSMLSVNSGTSFSASQMYYSVMLITSSVTGRGSDHITFRNMNFVGTGTIGISSGIVTGDEAGSGLPQDYSSSDNDFITIEANTFEKFVTGISIKGGADSTALGLNDWLIKDNFFGPSVSSSNNLMGSGVEMNLVSQFTITGNTFRNFLIKTNDCYPVGLKENCSAFSILQNTISTVTYSNVSVAGAGIFLGTSVFGGTISLNQIHTLTKGVGINGILINTERSNSGLYIQNNFISNIFGTNSSSEYACGIYVYASSGDIHINHNSISLATTGTMVTNSADIYFALTPTMAAGPYYVSNNIFSNECDNPNTSFDNHYGLRSSVTSTAFVVLNYNDYWANGSLAYSFQYSYNGVPFSTTSINQKPYFVSTTDLHLQPSNWGNYWFDNSAQTSSISIDIDQQTRSLTTPDMGADEFTNVLACTTASAGSITTAYTTCYQNSLSINSSSFSVGPNTTYQWQIATSPSGTFANISSGVGYTSPAYTGTQVPGVLYYRLETTCVSGTNISVSVSNISTVTTISYPTPTLVASPPSICPGVSSTISAQGTATLYWSTGSYSPGIVVTPTQSAIYYAYFNGSYCPVVYSNTVILYVSINPTISVSSLSSAVCPGTAGTLIASGASTYSWSNGVSSATNNPSPFSNTTYTVTGFNTAGCTHSTVISLSVVPAPTLAVSGNTTICSGQSTTLTASGAVNFLWSTSSSGSLVVVSPTTNTTYSVTGDNGACAATRTIAVISNTVPVLVVNSSAASVCINSAATLSVSGASSYTWSNLVTGLTTTVALTTPTIYTVTGINTLSCSASQTIGLGIYALPILSITPQSPGICANSAQILTAYGANTYTWNGSTQSSSITVSPSASTVFTVVGTESLNNCRGTQTVAVTVNPLPSLSLSGAGASVCAGSTASYTVSGAGSYTWSNSTFNSTLQLTPVGTASYYVIGITAAGCTSTLNFSLGTYSLPVVSVLPLTSTVCQGQSTVLSASGAGSYNWNNFLTGPVITVSPSTSGIYTVTGISAQNCTAAASASVYVNPSPTITISGPATAVCPKTAVILNATGALTYLWNTAATTASISVNPALTQTYTVTGTNANSCNTSTTITVFIHVVVPPAITPIQPTICAHTMVILSGPGTYTWMPGNSISSTFSASPLSNAQYTVTGIDQNQCTNTLVVNVMVDACTGLQLGAGMSKMITLFPNPANNSVFLHMPVGHKKILLTNGLSEEIVEIDSENENETLNVEFLPKGLYFLRVEMGGDETTFKVVIN